MRLRRQSDRLPARASQKIHHRRILSPPVEITSNAASSSKSKSPGPKPCSAEDWNSARRNVRVFNVFSACRVPIEAALADGRQLIVSPFAAGVDTPNVRRAAWCNQYVLAHCHRIAIGHLNPDGMLACILTEANPDIEMIYLSRDAGSTGLADGPEPTSPQDAPPSVVVGGKQRRTALSTL